MAGRSKNYEILKALLTDNKDKIRVDISKSNFIRDYFRTVLKESVAKTWSAGKTKDMLRKGVSTALWKRIAVFDIVSVMSIVRGGMLGASVIDDVDYIRYARMIQQRERFYGMRDLGETESSATVCNYMLAWLEERFPEDKESESRISLDRNRDVNGRVTESERVEDHGVLESGRGSESAESQQSKRKRAESRSESIVKRQKSTSTFQISDCRTVSIEEQSQQNLIVDCVNREADKAEEDLADRVTDQKNQGESISRITEINMCNVVNVNNSFKTRNLITIKLESSSQILIVVNNKLTLTLIDTGCQESTISLIYFSTLGVQYEPDKEGKYQELANGDLIKVLGRVELLVEIEEMSIPFKFHIVEGIKDDLIIGRNFLQALGCKIDWEDMTLTVKNRVLGEVKQEVVEEEEIVAMRGKDLASV